MVPLSKLIFVLLDLFREKEGESVECPDGGDNRYKWLLDNINRGFVEKEVKDKIEGHEIEMVRISGYIDKLDCGYKLIFYRRFKEVGFIKYNKTRHKLISSSKDCYLMSR